MGAALLVDKSKALEDVRAERARRAKESFACFVSLIRPEYARQWFHDLIIEELELAGTSPRDTRFGMAIPPGHAKSEYAMLFCAWMAARDPNIQVKYITYNTDFAKQQFGRLKDILNLPRYVKYFGRMINSKRVVTDTRNGAKNSAEHVDLLQGRGWIQACGFGGGITGGRCDLMVIDDPYKGTEDAGSPAIRERRWREYGAAVKTRRRVGRPLRILMLFTRWHLDDLTGRCKRHEPKHWRWVEIDALKEAANDNAEVEARDPRELEEALWPELVDAETLKHEREVFPEIFACVWQGRPVPPGGAVFKAKWFTRRYEHAPEAFAHMPGQWVQSWDCRNDGKSKTSSEVSAGLWFIPTHEPASAYLVDVKHGRWSPDETLAQFDALQGLPLWSRTSVRLIEAKADGKMLLSLRQHQYSGMTPIEPKEDKLTRARAITPFAAAGQLVLPEEAEWLGAFYGQLITFPAAANDDHVDMTSQFMSWKYMPELEEQAQQDPLEAARARMSRWRR